MEERGRRLPALLTALALNGACPEAAASETCRRPTGGTLRLPYSGCDGYTGRCFRWMNARCTLDHKCECREDECVMGEQCVPKGACPTVTGGSCAVGGCDAWRNASCNEAAARCFCGPGTCPIKGECRPPGTCAKDSGGTCHVFGCEAWRRADCSVRVAPGLTERAKCMCGEGACPLNGECVREGGCPRYVGASCRMYGWFGLFGCSAGQCSEAHFCECPEGQCYVGGRCAPADGATVRLSRDWAAAQEAASAPARPAAALPLALASGALLAAAAGCAAAWRGVRARAKRSVPPSGYEYLEG